MILPTDLKPFLSVLEAVGKLIEQSDDGGVVIGGVAVGLIGEPRYTADIDAMILAYSHEPLELLEMAQLVGLEARISDAAEFAERSRVLLLHHPISGIDVDISLGILPFEAEMVERRAIFKSEGIQVYLPTAEDLVIMKAVAHRPKDLEDIRQIVRINPNLDTTRIEHWTKGYAAILENPTIWTDVELILNAAN